MAEADFEPATPGKARPRPGRFKLFISLLLLLIVMLAAVWFAQQRLLGYACGNLEKLVGLPLQCVNASGSVPGFLRVQKLVYRTDNYSLELQNTRIDVRLSALLARRVVVNEVEVDRLIYRQLRRSGKPIKLPRTISLPLALDIRQARLHELQILTLNKTTVARDLSAVAQLDRRIWRISKLNGRLFGQQWSGDAQLNPRYPFAHDAVVQVRGKWKAHDWRGTVSAHGKLAEQIELKASGFLDRSPFQAQGLVNITHEKIVHDASARIQSWPLHEWIPNMPQVVADVRASARPDDRGGWFGELGLDNRTPGPLNRKRLPALNASSRWRWQPSPNALALDDIVFSLPDHGRLRGSLLWSESLSITSTATRIDLKQFWSSLHRTQLDGPFQVRTLNYRSYAVTADLKQGRDRLQGRALIDRSGLRLSEMALTRGNSAVTGRGSVQFARPRAFRAELALKQLNPADFGRFPGGRLNGKLDVSGRLQPRLDVEARALITESSLWGEPFALSGSGRYDTSGHIGADNIVIHSQSLQARLNGNLGAAGQQLTISARLNGAPRWLPGLAGQAQMDGTLTGRLRWPAFSGTLNGRDLRYRDWRLGTIDARAVVDLKAVAKQAIETMPDTELRLSAAGLARGDLRVDGLDINAKLAADSRSIKMTAAAQGIRIHAQTINEALLQWDGPLALHRIKVMVKHPREAITMLAEGGWDPKKKLWTGNIRQFDGTGSLPLRLSDPVPVEASRNNLAIGAVNLISRSANIQMRYLRWQAQRWSSEGRFAHLLVRDIWLLFSQQVPSADLILGGDWNIAFDSGLSGRARIFRESGDIRPVDELQTLGLDHGVLELTADRNKVNGKLDVRSKAIGRVNGEISTELSQQNGRLGLPGNAPLSGSLQANIPSLAWLGQWFTTPGYAFSGSFTGNVGISGTVKEPLFDGKLAGHQLVVKSAAHGLYLQQGELGATIERDRILVDHVRFVGGAGSVSGEGMLSLRQNDPDISVDLVARQLTLSNRPDQKLVVSGTGRASLRNNRLALRAEVKVDEGKISLKSTQDTELDDDIVLPEQRREAEKPQKKMGLFVNAKVDLGDDFEVKHKSFNAHAKGILRLSSSPERLPRLSGNVEIDEGWLAAYGQKLTMEPSTLNFNGPPDNPALNLKAYKERQYNDNGDEVRVGVNLTGTARKPVLRLISEPEMNDRQKLAWLVFGRDIYRSDNDASGAEADRRAVLTTAAKALWSEFDDGGPGFLNRTIGIDDISFQQDAKDISSGIIKIGKQLMPNLYVSYGRGYNKAEDEWQLIYLFNKKWSVEVNGGRQNAVDLFYTISFD